MNIEFSIFRFDGTKITANEKKMLINVVAFKAGASVAKCLGRHLARANSENGEKENRTLTLSPAFELEMDYLYVILRMPQKLIAARSYGRDLIGSCTQKANEHHFQNQIIRKH